MYEKEVTEVENLIQKHWKIDGFETSKRTEWN
jgi:hypothetical protein